VTPAEAVELLTLAAAFDRRTVGEADARAWAAALHDVPLDQDARAAVARHHAESTAWFTPAHLRSIRHRIRAERLGDTPPAYEPPAGPETGAEYVTRRRQQLAAIAAGEIPRPAVALDAAPSDRLRAALARVGEMPDHIRHEITESTGGRIGAGKARFPELAVPCPRPDCRAQRHMPCKRPSGRELREHTHDQRQAAYAALLARESA
jgi:hypothetical protein